MRLVSVLACLLLATPASAEPFFDIIAGGAFTENDAGIDYEESALIGIRAGAWGEGELPFLGGAVDISGFSPDGEGAFQGADLAVVPISFLLMGRLPLLTSPEFPHGQVHPYLGLGPSLVVSWIDWSVPGSDLEDVEADLGLDFRAGLSALLTERVGLFAEYRYLYFEPTFRDSAGGVGFPDRIHLEFDSHFIQAGLRLSF